MLTCNLLLPGKGLCLTTLHPLLPGGFSNLPVGLRIGIDGRGEFREKSLCSLMGEVSGIFEGKLLPMLGMIDQGTVDEEVFRKGLPGTDLLKQGGVQGFDERLLLNVVIGEVAKDAGFQVTPGIDMEIFPPSGDTSFSQASIIPEIYHEKRLRRPEMGKPLSYPGPLFRSGHQAEIGIAADGDIMEVPEEDAPLLHQKIDKGIASNRLRISYGLSGGDGEEDPCLFKPLHHQHNPIEVPFPPSFIGLGFHALEADRWHHIAQCNEPLDHLLIDQGAIRIDLKNGVRMLLKKIEEIGPDKGLSAGNDDKVDAHLIALLDEAIHDLKGELFLSRIRTRITAKAVEIASHRRADEHGIGRLKPSLLFKRLPPIGAYQQLVDDEVGDDLLPVIRMGLIQKPSRNGQGRMIVLKKGSDPANLFAIRLFLGNPLREITEPDQIFFGGAGQKG